MISDAAGRAIQIGRFKGNPYILNLGITSTNLQLKSFKTYRVWASVNAFFQVGVDNTVTASVSSHPLTAGLDTLHVTDDVSVWVAGIVASGTGVLMISELDTTTV